MSDADGLRFRDILKIPGIRAAMLGTFAIMLGFGILPPVLPDHAGSFGVGYEGGAAAWVLRLTIPETMPLLAQDRRGGRPVSARRARRQGTS